MQKATIEQYVTRFWNYVKKGNDSECWIWTGATVVGHGLFGYDGQNLKAHRLAYQFTNGPIPDGLCVCHRCDNPPCCNPAHLFLGTHKDNSDDKFSKGRNLTWEQRSEIMKRVSPIGENVHSAKLNEEQVREIRELHRCGMIGSAIAKQFGIGRHCVYGIVARKSWAHVI